MVELASLLTGLFIHVGTGCLWLDQRTDLNSLVGTVCFMHDVLA